MDLNQLRTDWKNWVPHLQRQFPHVQVPDIFPTAALWDDMLDRIADAHDLTLQEVYETLEDLWMLRVMHRSASQAA